MEETNDKQKNSEKEVSTSIFAFLDEYKKIENDYELLLANYRNIAEQLKQEIQKNNQLQIEKQELKNELKIADNDLKVALFDNRKLKEELYQKQHIALEVNESYQDEEQEGTFDTDGNRDVNIGKISNETMTNSSQ